ncbi:MAG: YMGG-like glycine zipper-containing protein [Pseudomonadota bacterium]
MRKSIQASVLLASALIFLGGCSNMSSRDQAMLSGAAVGAAGGAVIGNQVGNPVTGAVIGAGVGAATGFFINRHNGAED